MPSNQVSSVFFDAQLTSYRKFVEELGTRANKPPPTIGKDVLVVDATELPKEALDDVLTKAAMLNVPLLIRRYASRFGPIGRKNYTAEIIPYLTHQENKKRPSTTCQVQGEKERNFGYKFLIKYFQTDPKSRKMILNMLDNPVEVHPDLTEGFDYPEFIARRDVTGFALERPNNAYELREGLKNPSLRRWMLVSAEGSVSGFHIDGLGFWTAVQLQKGEPGSKYWFWTEQNQANLDYLEEDGQYDSVSKFTKVYAVRLDPGDLFVMNPKTIHAAVTAKDIPALGIHFLLRETLDRSIFSAKQEYEAKHLTNDKRNYGQAFYARLIKVSLFSRNY